MKRIFFLLVLSLGSMQAEVTPGQMFVKAAKDGDLQTIETLLSVGFNPNGPVHGTGYTPLWYAIECGRTDVVDLLLAAHADPNAKVMPGPLYPTPLQLALQIDNIRIASRLVEAGARVDTTGNYGRTALHDAAREARLDTMKFLIEKGADLNIRDAKGASALDDAIWRGSLDAAAILLAHGARLNESNIRTGATPINEAVLAGGTALVQYLLQFHPDLEISDKRGYSPLDNATRMGKEDSARLLLEAEPKERQTPQLLGKTLEAAAQKDESVLVENLLQHGVPANGTLPSGSTPLDVAVSAGAVKVVRVLLDNGADPNISIGDGASPLEDAALKGFDSIVGLLLDHGALVNQLNAGSGTTALYAAASFGKGEVVKLLLDRGANPSLCGNNRESPYQAALENGYSEVAIQIQNRGGRRRCEP